MNFDAVLQSRQESRKVIVPSTVVNRPPSEECFVYAGGRSDRKRAIRGYKQKYGVWPRHAFFCFGNQWWLPLPGRKEGEKDNSWPVEIIR